MQRGDNLLIEVLLDYVHDNVEHSFSVKRYMVPDLSEWIKTHNDKFTFDQEQLKRVSGFVIPFAQVYYIRNKPEAQRWLNEMDYYIGPNSPEQFKKCSCGCSSHKQPEVGFKKVSCPYCTNKKAMLNATTRQPNLTKTVVLPETPTFTTMKPTKMTKEEKAKAIREALASGDKARLRQLLTL